MPRKKQVNVTEAAEILAVSPVTIRRYLAQGRLTGSRQGPKLIRIDVESLESLGSPIGGDAA